MSSRILAIDPGNERSAWLLFTGGKPERADMLPNGELLHGLREGDMIERADILAVEMIASFGMPVGREVFDTCLWTGRFVEAWEARGGRTQLVRRRDVKLHLCGSTQAKDANVRQALIDLYGPGKERAIGRKAAPGPLYGIKCDEWSALAVAVTAHARMTKEALCNS